MVYLKIILNLWIYEVTGLCNVWKEWSIILHKRSISIIMGSKGWCRFKTRHQRHMWVEFVVSSLPYSERFSLSSNSNIFKFQFDQESGSWRTTLWMCYLQILFFYLFMQYSMYRKWFGGNQEFYYKILSFLIFAGFNTGTYLTWKRTEWTEEKKLCWSSFIASGGRERIQVQSKLSLRPLSWVTSSSHDHLCETPFELWLKLCN